MSKDSKIHISHIHDEDFLAPYHEKMITESSLICDRGGKKELISGYWHFAVDQYDTCLRARWYEEVRKSPESGLDYPLDYDFEQWEKVVVPSCWNMAREKYFYYEGCGIYTRTFKYISHGEDRVFLKFGAAQYATYIFVNKTYLGCHLGGSTPFNAEVTGLLQEDNRILVVVENKRDLHRVPMRNTDWFNYGGLYRDVELIRLPKTFIKEHVVGLVPGSGFKKISAEIVIDPSVSGEATLSIDALGIQETIPVKDGKGSIQFDASPELWHPDHPVLYDVQITFDKDVVTDRIGFREVSVNGTDIYLNGEKIFLRGVCAHEESVENGKAVTDDEIRETFRLAKEMNCNFMRLAHYPHTGHASRIADEMGVLLWEEIPVYWAIDFGRKETYADAENQLTELVKRDRNRASVILWSVGNENEDSDTRLQFMSSLAKKTRALDPTRLVSAACLVDRMENRISDRLQDHLDVIGVNEYLGWYFPEFYKLIELFEQSRVTKPVIITEFGAGARPGHHGTDDELFTEECQRAIYEKQVDTLNKIDYIKGITPWIFFDFRTPKRTNFFQDHYNRKGLLSADKSYKKPGFYVMQAFYQKKQAEK